MNMMNEDIAARLDKQPLSRQTGEDLYKLREFLKDSVSREAGGSDSDDRVSGLLREWNTAILEDLLEQEIEDEEEALTPRIYTDFQLEQTNGALIYRLHVHIDNAFGALTERVRRTTDLMLARVVAGRSECFVRTARREGLTWRRNRRLPFPHPLPYSSPPPTTDDQIFAEEAGVIAAAFHFALSNPAPGIDLVINHFSQGPSSEGFWVLGSAPVNLYNDTRSLRMRLNARAFPEFSDNIWAGTVAHEIMHNLGWGHPDGTYIPRIAIVNYDRCVRSADSLFEEEINDSLLIR
jgi:hypothetical protein